MARLSRLLPGAVSHAGGHRGELGCGAVRPTSAVHGLVAEREDRPGWARASASCHPTTWAKHPTCYLEDLYVAKAVGRRGRRTPAHSRPSVHSPTGSGRQRLLAYAQEYNAPARSLYDTVAHRDIVSSYTGSLSLAGLPRVAEAAGP